MKATVIIAILSLQFFCLNAQEKSDNQKENLYWLKPDHIRAQFAGNIGFVSVGAGYNFFKDVLSSDLIVGYVPKFIDGNSITTIVWKNTFQHLIFKSERINQFYPFFGFSVNAETGNNSFIKLPEQYPKGYYNTNAFTMSLFYGITYKGKKRPDKLINSIEYYAEMGTLASYLSYNLERKKYFNPDIWSIALGIKFCLNYESSRI